jgi:hypothetical protein
MTAPTPEARVTRCEWCEEYAHWRFRARNYMRFACGLESHYAKTGRLVHIDGHAGRVEVTCNPTGFSLAGRMLGPER